MSDLGQSFYHTNADAEFAKARRRSVLESIFAFAAGRRDEVVSLDEAKSLMRPTAESYRGMQSVEIARIVGSEGRYADFNRRFLPRRSTTANRWNRIHMAHQQEIALPAIQTYELGGYHFVRDGNHRVSVAVQLGMTFIDAQVTSLATEVELEGVETPTDLRAAVLEYERKKFMAALGSVESEGFANLRFTATGRYDDIGLHIAGHRRVIESRSGTKLDYLQATRAWYSDVYLPMAQLIRDSGVLAHMGNRTEADFYVWLVRHWDDIAAKPGRGYRPNRRLRGRFRRHVK